MGNSDRIAWQSGGHVFTVISVTFREGEGERGETVREKRRAIVNILIMLKTVYPGFGVRPYRRLSVRLSSINPA